MSRQPCTIEAGDGITLDARIFKPPTTTNPSSSPPSKGNIVIVLVHPYSVLGGCQGLMTGIARNLANQGLAAVTFDMRGVGRSHRVLRGAPIAGSAVDQVDEVVGYVSIGYPFGITASILFGRHHKAILQSPKPKLFITGTRDGFTSVNQLENKLKSAVGSVETHLIKGASHFELEGPAFDSHMSNLIVKFISKL